MGVWLLKQGLLHGRFECELPGPFLGRGWALINLATCNYACPYCITGGFAKDRAQRFPDSEEVELAQVLAFVERHCELGHPILVSGAEPLMATEAVAAIARTVREAGGLIQLMTNGSMPNELNKLLPLVDAVDIDVKAAPEKLAAVTGVGSRGLTWDKPLQSIERSLAAGVTTLVTTPCFETTTLEDLVEIGGALPEGVARWTVMQFVPASVRRGQWSLQRKDYGTRGFAWPEQQRTLDIVDALGSRLPQLAPILFSTSLSQDLVQLKAPWRDRGAAAKTEQTRPST